MKYVEYEEKMLQSFEYETTINSDGNLLGTCELGKATIEMLNENNNYSSFKGSWIKLPQGSFYIYNVEPVQERVNIKLECYDIKYKLDTLYDSSKHTFPCTLKEWRNSIFSECGVTYDNSDFPNSSLTLETEPALDNDISNRNVIALIAQAGASFIVTDKDDKFYFKWFGNTQYEASDWVELTTEKEATKAINYVVLGRGDVEDNYGYPLTKPESPVEFRIDNNYILDPQDTSSSVDLRETTIIPIYARVNGFSFIPFTMRTQFIENKLSIILGDKIKYKDIWGNTLTSYIMTKKIKWLSGYLEDPSNYEITLSSEEIKESSSDVSYSKDKNKELLEISRKTDKSAGKIEDLIKKTDETSKKMSEIEQTVDGVTTTVSTITTEVDNTIKSVSKQFKIKDSTDEWSDTYPTRQEGQIILAREKYVHTDDSITYGTEYEITGDKGDQGKKGDQGIQGPAGADGTSQYFFVRYSENSTGDPMTTTPTSTTKYMGVANTTSPTAPTSYSDYTWSLIKGNDGKDGTDGTPGAAGADGQTTYLHIKYSQDGKTFAPENEEYAEGETPSAWRGEYVDFTEADSMEFDDYKWYKLTEDIDGRLEDLESGLSDIGKNYKTYTDNEVGKVNEKFANYATNTVITEIKKDVTAAVKDAQYSIDVTKEIKENGVSKLKTSKGFTFDDEGMTINSTDSKTSFNADTDGINVVDKSSNTTLLFAGYDNTLKRSVVRTDNIEVDNYITIGDAYRLEIVEDDTYGKGLAFFYIGG